MSLALAGLIAAVNQDAASGGGLPQVAEPSQPIVERACNRAAGLDLDGEQLLAIVDDKVNLVPGAVPPEVQRRRDAPVGKRFQVLSRDEGFEDGAAHGMQPDVPWVPDAENVAQKPGVQEVQLGRPDDALGEVSVMRWQQVPVVNPREKTFVKDRVQLEVRWLRRRTQPLGRPGIAFGPV